MSTKNLRLALAIVMVTGLTMFVGPLSAADEVDGEQLVRGIWHELEANDTVSLQARMSPAFQSLHSDGARSAEQELQLIKGLHLGSYTLDKFDVTRDGGVLIVTYFVSVEETIDDKRLTGQPAGRMDVFASSDGGWKWLAHANLKPVS